MSAFEPNLKRAQKIEMYIADEYKDLVTALNKLLKDLNTQTEVCNGKLRNPRCTKIEEAINKSDVALALNVKALAFAFLKNIHSTAQRRPAEINYKMEGNKLMTLLNGNKTKFNNSEIKKAIEAFTTQYIAVTKRISEYQKELGIKHEASSQGFFAQHPNKPLPPLPPNKPKPATRRGPK